MAAQQLTKSKTWSGKRRSQRIELSAAVVLHRRPTEGPQFSERTQTLIVNAHGALVALAENVAPEQRLFMQNTNSGEQKDDPHLPSGASPIHPPIGLGSSLEFPIIAIGRR